MHLLLSKESHKLSIENKQKNSQKLHDLRLENLRYKSDLEKELLIKSRVNKSYDKLLAEIKDKRFMLNNNVNRLSDEYPKLHKKISHLFRCDL